MNIQQLKRWCLGAAMAPIVAIAAPEAKVEFEPSNPWWGGGFGANVKVTNVGDEPMQDWQLKFVLPHDITSHWSSDITSQNGVHTVTPMSWNKTLMPGQSMSFGFNGQASDANASKADLFNSFDVVNVNFSSSDPVVEQPVVIETPVVEPPPVVEPAPVNEQPAANVDYSKVAVSYAVTSDWGSGFNGAITIKNNSAAPINGWQLAFNGAGNITSMWNQESFANSGNAYNASASAAHWNGVIQPGKSKTLGFGANGSPSALTACTINGHACVITRNYVATETPEEATPTEVPGEEPAVEPTPDPVDDTVVEEIPVDEEPVVDEPNATETANDVEGVSAGYPTQPSAKRIIAYYAGWATYGRDHQVADIPGSLITHVNYAFINIANNRCVLGDSYADVEKRHGAETAPDGKTYPAHKWYYAPGEEQPEFYGNLQRLVEMKERNPHIKTLMSVGGWTWSKDFSEASNDANRAAFVKSCVDLMKQYKFDGVDIDWEYPTGNETHKGEGSNRINADDPQRFLKLLTEFRQQLGSDHLLTIAAPAGYEKMELIDQQADWKAIADQLDWINLMTYDLDGGWDPDTGHNAALYASTGADSERANVQDNGDGGLHDPAGPMNFGTWEDGMFDYSDLAENYINKNGYLRYWDAQAQVPYIYNPEKKVFISYEDKQSMQVKAQYTNSKNLGGMMFWESSSDANDDPATQDKDENYELLKEVYYGLNPDQQG